MSRIWMAVAVVGLASCASGDMKKSAKGVLRHVVLFKFKDDSPPDAIRAVEEKFRTLKDRIPNILDFEWGTNVSPEKKNEGFTHCFFVTFPDAAARDAYLPHPPHQEFVALLRPHLDKVLVVDYVARD